MPVKPGRKMWAQIVFDYSTSNSYGVKAFWGSCAGNYDTDEDIDGLDFFAFTTDYANEYVTGDDLLVFAENFGLMDGIIEARNPCQQRSSILFPVLQSPTIRG